MAQKRQLLLQCFRHDREIKAAEQFGHDQHLALRKVEHVAQFPLAEDVHQRIHHRADATAGQRRDHELPPIGQLHGHDIATHYTHRTQGGSGAADPVAELPVAQANRLFTVDPVSDQGLFIRFGLERALQKNVHILVQPKAGLSHGRPARRQCWHLIAHCY